MQFSRIKINFNLNYLKEKIKIKIIFRTNLFIYFVINLNKMFNIKIKYINLSMI